MATCPSVISVSSQHYHSILVIQVATLTFICIKVLYHELMTRLSGVLVHTRSQLLIVIQFLMYVHQGSHMFSDVLDYMAGTRLKNTIAYSSLGLPLQPHTTVTSPWSVSKMLGHNVLAYEGFQFPCPRAIEENWHMRLSMARSTWAPGMAYGNVPCS